MPRGGRRVSRAPPKISTKGPRLGDQAQSLSRAVAPRLRLPVRRGVRGRLFSNECSGWTFCSVPDVGAGAGSWLSTPVGRPSARCLSAWGSTIRPRRRDRRGRHRVPTLDLKPPPSDLPRSPRARCWHPSAYTLSLIPTSAAPRAPRARSRASPEGFAHPSHPSGPPRCDSRPIPPLARRRFGVTMPPSEAKASCVTLDVTHTIGYSQK